MASFDDLPIEAREIVKAIGNIDCAMGLYLTGIMTPCEAERLVAEHGYRGAVTVAEDCLRKRLAQRPPDGGIQRKKPRRALRS